MITIGVKTTPTIREKRKEAGKGRYKEQYVF
jgi:hypothetical protein